MPLQAQSADDRIAVLTSTLLANGYWLRHTRRTTHGLLLTYDTVDHFGIEQTYLVALLQDGINEAGLKILRGLASGDDANLVMIGNGTTPVAAPLLSFDQFVGRLGGVKANAILPETCL
jgi:hypothetical protein